MAEGWKRYAGISVLAFCYCAFVGFPLYLAYTMLARHLILATDSTISRHISLLGLRLRTRIYPKHSFQSLNMNEVKRGPFGGVRLQVLSLVGPKDDLELAAFEEADKAASVAHLISGFLELPLEVKGSRN
ncbi:MAG: hypothetical protein JWM68_465 [Verrucomicrobiales bacterium]|nr:hypothetical protein [Verrucomicrobiales bacterium]